jgi:hypothetical protein
MCQRVVKRIAAGRYIKATLTRDIGYTCEGIIDDLLIQAANFAGVSL